MLREAFEWIGALRQQALEPITLLKREDQVVMIDRAGTRFDYSLPAGPKSVVVNSLSDLIVACGRWGSDKSVLFHSRDKVTLVIDDTSRRDRVTLNLGLTDVATTVLRLPEATLDHKSFLKLLRRELAKVIPTNLVAAISKIEVVTNASQKSEVNPGRERGTREFAADLAGSGEIPERVLCMVPIYQMEGLNDPQPIEFSLEYTLPPQPVTFQFRPLPDELERAFEMLQGQLHQLLIDGLAATSECEGFGIDVLYGEP